MKVFTEKQLADYLKLSQWTIRRWRLKSGLPYFKGGKRIFYRLESVAEWMASNEKQNTSMFVKKSNRDEIIA